jgi:hypothetical protein
MSKKKGTAERLFRPLYVDGQDAADFEKRVWENKVVATAGVTANKNYLKARLVRFAWQVMKAKQAQIENEPNNPVIEGWKAVAQITRTEINKFIDDALETNDAKSLRLLAEVLESVEPRSTDALLLINFCQSKPHDYIFTFKELLQGYAAGMKLTHPFDEAIEQRVRRLIKIFGIRIHKRQ